MVEWARRADAASFSTLGTLDRVVYANFDPVATLAAAATVTSRIRLTTAILIGPYRGNGALLAKQLASVDALSGGRLTVGISVGGREDDFAATDSSFAERGANFDGMLARLHTVWTGEADASRPVGPTPAQQGGPPLLIGGGGKAAFRRTAEYGAGWIAAGGGPEMFAQGAEQVRAAWSQAGRDGQPRFAALTYFSLGNDADRAAQEYLTDYYSFLGDFAAQIAQSALTTPAAVRGAVQSFEAAGCDELICFPCSTIPTRWTSSLPRSAGDDPRSAPAEQCQRGSPVVRVGDGSDWRERRAWPRPGRAVGDLPCQRQRRVDQLDVRAERLAQRSGDVPGVRDRINQVKPDDRRDREARPLADLDEAHLSVRRRRGESVHDPVGGRLPGVGHALGVGGSRGVCRSRRFRRLDRLREAVVLPDDMPEQGAQVPVVARRRSSEVGTADATDKWLGEVECTSMQRTEVPGGRHRSIIYCSRRLVKRYRLTVSSTHHPDLGAMLYRLARTVAGAEMPVLARHGIEMWDYVVLSSLQEGPASTQAQLAVAVGRDKTRLISILDRLEARGLLARTPDPADRRNRIVALTEPGRAMLAKCRASVHALEEDLLAGLTRQERDAFRATLERLDIGDANRAPGH